jgi:hypothetical protein
MRKLFLLATATIFSFLTSTSQSITPFVINATGGTSQVTDKFYVDWSVAEMTLVNTMQNTGFIGLFIITNGFIQPPLDDADGTEFLVSSPKPEIITNLRVYPNPATNYVMIELPVQEAGKIRITLFNSMGEMVYDKQFTSYGQGTREKISMAAFMQGTYMLRVVTAATGRTPKEANYKIFKAN